MSLKHNAKTFFQENREALQELIKEQVKKTFEESKVWLKKQYEEDKEKLAKWLEEKILSKRIKSEEVDTEEDSEVVETKENYCDAVETEDSE